MTWVRIRTRRKEIKRLTVPSKGQRRTHKGVTRQQKQNHYHDNNKYGKENQHSKKEDKKQGGVGIAEKYTGYHRKFRTVEDPPSLLIRKLTPRDH